MYLLGTSFVGPCVLTCRSAILTEYRRPSGATVVDVSYRNSKIGRLCAAKSVMKRELGPQTAAKLAQRLAEIAAVDSLADLGLLPGPRLHELRADRNGQLSLDLVHPRRLIIEPDHVPHPTKPDGGLDWTKVTSVVVVEITDTH
jgi:plasmid maintenance system killer protein